MRGGLGWARWLRTLFAPATELLGTRTAHGFDVLVRLAEPRTIEICVDGRGHIPAKLELHSRASSGLLPRRSFPTGDAELDRVVIVAGNATIAAALLSWEVRRLLIEVVGRLGASLSAGVLSLHEPAKGLDAQRLEALVDSLARTAAELRLEPVDVPIRLLSQSRADPLPALRDAALRLLLENCSDRPEAREAASEALEHPNAFVRLARELVDGQEGLLRVADAARDVELAVDLRAYAARQVLARYPKHTPREVAVSVLRVGPLPVLEAALAEISRVDQTDLLPELYPLVSPSMFSGPPTPRFYLALVRALGAYVRYFQRGVELPPPVSLEEASEVIARLLFHPDVEVSVFAAVTLGRVGSANELPALAGLVTIAPVFERAALRRDAAEAASSRIRERLGAQLGGLSLADPTADGQLTLYEDEAGGLSDPESSA
ncbi:MAG: hypothetical protein HYV07_10365 [Deltaproteobacteria bacterium]|nr:hypothetical protein [Deltaproteobacteria bacterium]